MNGSQGDPFLLIVLSHVQFHRDFLTCLLCFGIYLGYEAIFTLLL